jgi:hypothetical protein
MLCNLNEAFYKPSSILTDFLEKQKNETEIAKKYEDKNKLEDKYEKKINEEKKDESKIAEIVRDITLNNIMKDIVLSKDNKIDTHSMNCNNFLYHLQTCKLCRLYTKNLYKKKAQQNNSSITSIGNVLHFKGDMNDYMKIIINIVLVVIIIKVIVNLFK